MPVHNALPYLDEAVLSILEQSHRDFEFVIGDDASTDGSTEALRRWAAQDPRIRLLERRDNLGPAGSANWVAGEARGDLVARMDADDVSHPDRLRRQLAVLRQNADAALVGSPPIGIDAGGRTVRKQDRAPLPYGMFGPPIAHGSILYRRAAFEAAGGYREQCRHWEDVDLYLRIARTGRLLVLPDAVYYYRHTASSTRLNVHEEEVERAVDLMFRCRAAHQRGGDYEGVLARAADHHAPRFTPATYVSIAGGRIWAGESPRMFRRMCRRAAFPTDRSSARAWLMILCGTLSPPLLRALLAARQRRRNRAGPPLRDGQIYEWRPFVAATISGHDTAVPESQAIALPSAP